MLQKHAERFVWGAFLCFLFLISWTQITDYDFWYHLNLGRQILAELNPAVRDGFSYTFFGREQFNAEWLGDLIIYLAYSAGGFPGVNLLKFFLLAATFYCLRRVARERGAEGGNASLLAIVTVLVVVLFSMRFRLFIRPFLFSYLFVALFFWLLTLYRNQRDIRLLWILPALQILWANASKGAFYGPLLVALWVVFDFIGRRFDRRLALAFLAVTGASFVNPDVTGLYHLLAQFAAGEEQVLVGEHRPLSLMLLWGGGFSYTWGFQVLAFTGLLYLVWKGRGDAQSWIVYLLFLMPAIMLVRMIDFFSLAAVFFVVPPVARVIDGNLAGRICRSRTSVALVCSFLVGLGLVSVLTSKSYAFGASAKEKYIPEGAVGFLSRHNHAGRVFNSFPFGGYIAWKNPALQVYIDGRMNQLFPQSFLKRYFQAIHTPQAFAEEEKQWDFDIAILEYDLMSDGRNFPKHIVENPGWALVYWDNHSTVYLKRSLRNKNLIDRYAYRLAQPRFNQFEYLNAMRHQSAPARLLEDARHDISLNPNNQEPRLAYVFLLYSLGSRQFMDEMLTQLEACLALEPDLPSEHSARGLLLLQQGRKEEAEAEAKQALGLDPGDAGAQSIMKALGKG